MAGSGGSERVSARHQHLQRSAGSDVDLKQAAQLLGSFKNHNLNALQGSSLHFPEPTDDGDVAQQLLTPTPTRRPTAPLLRTTPARNWALLDAPSDSEEDELEASYGARSLPSASANLRSFPLSSAPSKSQPASDPSAWQGFQVDTTSPRSGQASQRSLTHSKRSTPVQERALEVRPSQRRKVSSAGDPDKDSPHKLGSELLSGSSGMQGLTATRRSRGTDQDTTSSGMMPQRSSRSGIASREAIPCASAARLRGSKGQGPGSLHPVLALGWKPLCEVHCNGLVGKFLGGHDRDLYIQCTSKDFEGLAPVDVAQGGCILSCSQFEKCAGRELSKKWKESIHVTGEGEGSKATLIAWLKRRAAQQYGQRVVGQHVWVCWCADATFYKGLITHYSPETGKHKVRYGDRFVEELHLPVEVLSFESDQPGSSGAAPRDLPSAAPETPASEGDGRLAHASPLPWTTPPREALEREASIATLTKSVTEKLPGLLNQDQIDAIMHQGSGVSVTSGYKLNAEWKLNQQDMDRINCGVEPLLHGIAVQRDTGLDQAAAGSLKTDTGQPGSKSDEQENEACCGDSMSLDMGVVPDFPKKPRSGRTPKACKPAMLMSDWLASILPADMPTIPDPPSPTSTSEVPEHAQLAWLHELALYLDPALSLPELAQSGRTMSEFQGRTAADTSAGSGDGDGPALSASACFQALLVHATPAAAKGYFQALGARHRHFKAQPQQQAKLVEFVLAALQQRPAAAHEASQAPGSFQPPPNTGSKPSPAPMTE